MYLSLDPASEPLGELAGRQVLASRSHQLEARLVATPSGTANRREENWVVEATGNHVAAHEKGRVAVEERSPMAAIARDRLLIGRKRDESRHASSRNDVAHDLIGRDHSRAKTTP